ncbi:unnamed protein product [Penicillium olsonii]|nr:unnamed protein product [Penicillium olsonii]
MGLISRHLNDQSIGGFFGDSSTVAFINQLQDAVSKTPAPLQASRRQFDPKTATNFNANDLQVLLPPRTLADHLVDCYFSKIHSLYPFVHKEAFLTAYDSLRRNKDTPSGRSTNGLGLGDAGGNLITFYYGLNMIFALGCQFSDIVQHEREAVSEAFFQTCKPVLDLDYLENGDLALAQTLLLMAHYLQGSRTPNRCWHVIGTACRLAQGVGLHSDVGNEHRSFAETQIRRRVWHGCVMLDL